MLLYFDETDPIRARLLTSAAVPELLSPIVGTNVFDIRSAELVLLDFREITADLAHRVISRKHTARRPPCQLADFQGGLSRTGGNDEHPAPVFHSYGSASAPPARKLVRDVRSESGGRQTEISQLATAQRVGLKRIRLRRCSLVTPAPFFYASHPDPFEANGMPPTYL